MSTRDVKLVTIGEQILADNDESARQNRKIFDHAGVLAINVMAAPGSGKTSLISSTLEALSGWARIAVIEGDVAGSIDTQRVLSAGAVDAVQINTGGSCHLEANMIARALDDLDLDQLDVLFLENVGNLICPTSWDLGEHVKVCLVGAAEGDDKPAKYPEMFAGSDVIVLNKVDLIPLMEFDMDFFDESVQALNPNVPVFKVSCRTGEAIDGWANWLRQQYERHVPAMEAR